jgi:uncharacterized membrane protein YiaA
VPLRTAKMTTNRHIKLGRIIALISFLVGTVIFGLYYMTSAFELLFVGYGFIALIGLINIGVLIAILTKARKDKENRSRLLKTCGLMTLNIPFMIVYCWVAIILFGTMRITFTNETGTELTDINIIGCGGGHIDKLEIGESETVWVSITGDCSIDIDYLSNGQRKEEVVAGYVTSSMGQKVNHKIDGQDKDII